MCVCVCNRLVCACVNRLVCVCVNRLCVCVSTVVCDVCCLCLFVPHPSFVLSKINGGGGGGGGGISDNVGEGGDV